MFFDHFFVRDIVGLCQFWFVDLNAGVEELVVVVEILDCFVIFCEHHCPVFVGVVVKLKYGGNPIQYLLQFFFCDVDRQVLYVRRQCLSTFYFVDEGAQPTNSAVLAQEEFGILFDTIGDLCRVKFNIGMPLNELCANGLSHEFPD